MDPTALHPPPIVQWLLWTGQSQEGSAEDHPDRPVAVAFNNIVDRFRLLLSEVSICLLVKEQDILKEPVVSSIGLTQRVDPATW